MPSATPTTTSPRTGVSRSAGEVEVGYDPNFENKWWIFEQSCWVVYSLALIAAVLGLFGRGPLTHQRILSADGLLQVEYDSVVHFRTPAELKFKVDAQAIQNNVVQIWISDGLYSHAQVQQVFPRPLQQTRTGAGTTFTFAADPDSPIIVSFRLEPSSLGRIQAEARIPDHVPIRFHSVILP